MVLIIMSRYIHIVWQLMSRIKKTGEGTLNGSLKMQRYVNVHDTLCADHCCSHRTEVELMIRLL